MNIRSLIGVFILHMLFACHEEKQPHISFSVIDTDFSKGRLNHVQTVDLQDLEKFHGHLCDGLIVGALAMQEVMKSLYPDGNIDRTNLRIVSKPSPCLTDVAIYLTGGRYQYNTFYADTTFSALYIVQRIDNGKTVKVRLNPGIKPKAVDSLGKLAELQMLSACGLDSLKNLEDEFGKMLLTANPAEVFSVESIQDFEWRLVYKAFLKTDILNKNADPCQ